MYLCVCASLAIRHSTRSIEFLEKFVEYKLFPIFTIELLGSWKIFIPKTRILLLSDAVCGFLFIKWIAEYERIFEPKQHIHNMCSTAAVGVTSRNSFPHPLLTLQCSASVCLCKFFTEIFSTLPTKENNKRKKQLKCTVGSLTVSVQRENIIIFMIHNYLLCFTWGTEKMRSMRSFEAWKRSSMLWFWDEKD